jgi:hypothetical protein
MFRGHGFAGAMPRSQAPSIDEFRYELTRCFFDSYLVSLASDVGAARIWKAPLGTTERSFELFSRDLKWRLSDGEIAFRLGLPILEGIDPKLLVRLRRDEQPYFERFRDSIRTAIRDRARVQGRADADKLANEIKSDVIMPALRQVEARLSAARRQLLKKAGQSIVLGSFATVVGLLTANPVLVAAGLTPTIATAATAAHKFVEQTDEVRLADMYFLWKARRHRHSRRASKSPATAQRTGLRIPSR